MDESFDTLPSRLALMSADRRLRFFELLAHNLTVAARGAWASDSMTAQEQVASLKTFNECLHRVTARMSVERLGTHEWTHESFCGLLFETDNALHPELQGSVKWAARLSYELATSSA